MIQMRGAVVCCRNDLPVATAVVVGATSRSRFLCEFTDCNGGARVSIRKKAGGQGISIARVWLSIGEKAGAQGISIAVIIHSFDRTLHIGGILSMGKTVESGEWEGWD